MRTRQRKRPISEINVVPYIDVMLVLLIIFMITAPLLMQGVNVQLPQGKTKALSHQNKTPLIVSVDRSGRYFLNISPHPSQAISPRALMTQVAARLTIAKEKHEEKPVYVKGDRHVSYHAVMQAMVLLQKAGANHLALMTRG